MAETTSLSSKQPRKEIFQDIATELGVSPSFIEKDWYAVQVLQAISNYKNDKLLPVFSGGTNLSKAYGLIERFSEDIDFRTNVLANFSRQEIRRFRGDIVDLVNGVEGLSVIEDTIKSRDGSKFFSFDIEYPKMFETDNALRANLKLEMKVLHPQIDTELRDIKSFISTFTDNNVEAKIQCIKPVEIAADKLSALIWRVLDRDRSADHDDPAMIRHLHDLCALYDVIKQNKEVFVGLANHSFNEDLARGTEVITASLEDTACEALSVLVADEEYQREYNQFVNGMSYSKEADQVSFEDAILSLKSIISMLQT